jgi:EpsI family protein
MLIRAVIVSVCLCVAARVVVQAERHDRVPVRTTFDSFPRDIGPWRGTVERPFDPAIVKVLGVNDYLTRAYFDPDRAGVGLYVGYWESQRQGSAIHSPLNCLPGAGWEPIAKGTLAVPSPDRDLAPFVVNRYVVQKGLDRQLVLYWFQSHGRVIASEYWSKFYLVTDAVRLHRSDGAIVRVIVPVRGESADAEMAAERTALRFIRDLFPHLHPYLPS